MLIFASICPHPPILIPTIGQRHLKKIKKTVKAMQNLEEELYATKPEVIIIISPHGELLRNAFTIGLNLEYPASLENFGDFSTKKIFKGEVGLANLIKETVEVKIPLRAAISEELDHGSFVPLYYLTLHLPTISIISLGYSLLDPKTHFQFGNLLKEIILNTNKRIALVASGDLSHRLTKDAPAGYSRRGQEFDQKLMEMIQLKNIAGILNLDPGLIEEAAECGLRSFIILFGILEGINYTPEILSYEGPFGVGYLVANFRL